MSPERAAGDQRAGKVCEEVRAGRSCLSLQSTCILLITTSSTVASAPGPRGTTAYLLPGCVPTTLAISKVGHPVLLEARPHLAQLRSSWGRRRRWGGLRTILGVRFSQRRSVHLLALLLLLFQQQLPPLLHSPLFFRCFALTEDQDGPSHTEQQVHIIRRAQLGKLHICHRLHDEANVPSPANRVLPLQRVLQWAAVVAPRQYRRNDDGMWSGDQRLSRRTTSTLAMLATWRKACPLMHFQVCLLLL